MAARKRKPAIQRGMGHPASAADDFVEILASTAAKVLKKRIHPDKVKAATRYIKSTASQEAYLSHANKQYKKIKGSSPSAQSVKRHIQRKATVSSFRVGDRKEALGWLTMEKMGIADRGIKAKGINKAYQEEYNNAAAKFASVRKAKQPAKKAAARKVNKYK